MICDICYSKSTAETLANLIENDVVNKKIQVLGYGQYKYDLVHLRNLTIKKLNHLPRAPTEEETILYKEKYHLMNTGENNPMYQQYWNEEKRRRVRAKLKGKNSGSNNGMFGKPSTMLGKKDEKSVSGYDYYLVDKDNNVINYFRNTIIASQQLNLSKEEIKRFAINHIIINDHYLIFTERSRKIYKSRKNQKHGNMKNKGGRKVKLYSQDNVLIKEYPTITAVNEELKFDSKKIKNNRLILPDKRYIICDKSRKEVQYGNY